MEEFCHIIDKYIKIDNKIIFDIGSRDCCESIKFYQKYPQSKIYAFECNPTTIPLCKENIKNYPSITLIAKAVNNFDGECTFYPIDTEKTQTSWKDGNPGASSLFKANGLYDHIEKYVQNQIKVECVRLDTFCKNNNIDHIDVIWIDLQGAELLAFESLGNIINNVGIIYSEISHKPIYHDQCLFEQVNSFLCKHNFVILKSPLYNDFQEDLIYLNKNIYNLV